MVQGFVDETRLEVSSGNGGAGAVSFRREKYVPKGGPDGGDGGKGGDLVFEIRNNLKTLTHLSSKHLLSAKNGDSGKGKRMHGKNGDDLVIKIPPGTLIKNFKTHEILHDFAENKEGDRFIFLKGGRGGQGNWHFRSSRIQNPRFSQPGADGECVKILLELNMIADIGFVGFPSAGKSSLLKSLTNADPQIAAYHFTTKIPNLGMMRIYERDVVLADIPGIIEGASEGLGLGFQFLRHISRTAGLAFLIDLGEENYREAFIKLLEELKEFSPDLVDKPRIIIGSKTDLDEDGSRLKALKEEFSDEDVLGISIFSGDGLDELRQKFLDLAG